MPSFNFRLLRYKLIFAIFVWLLVQSITTASTSARGSITYALENMIISGRYLPIPLLTWSSWRTGLVDMAIAGSLPCWEMQAGKWMTNVWNACGDARGLRSGWSESWTQPKLLMHWPICSSCEACQATFGRTIAQAHRWGRQGLDQSRRSKDSVHRARVTLGKRILREFQWKDAGWIAKRRNLLLAPWSPNHCRKMEEPLQHQTTTQCIGLPPTCARGHHPDGPKANHALIFNLNHSSGAAHWFPTLRALS